MTFTPRRVLACVGALIASLAIAACGDSKSDDSSSGSSGAAKTAGTAPAPTGKPIKVMIASTLSGPTSLPEVPAGAESAASAINARGGIDGRPLKVIVCDDANPSAEACARKAVAEKVAAVVGAQSFGINAILEANGIAQIGNFPFTPDDYKAPNSFPLAAGLDVLGGAVKLADSIGAKVIQPMPLAGSQPFAEAVAQMSATADNLDGMEVLPPIALPFPSTDLSAQVAKAAGTDADALVVVGLAPQDLQVLQAARAASLEQELIFFGATVPQSFVDKVKSAAEGIYLISSFRATSSNDPEIVRFKEEIEQYFPDAEQTDLALNSWAAMQLFELAAKQAGSIDAAGILKVMPTLKDVDLGVTGPFSFGERGPLDTAPRIVNLQTFASQVKDGVITQVSDTPEPAYP